MNILSSSSAQDPERFQESHTIQLGQWYWVNRNRKDEEQWFGCVMSIGSNYVEVRKVGKYGGSCRIHLDKFLDICKQETNPRGIIDGQVQLYKGNVENLLLEIKELTQNLGVAQTTAIEQQNEARALSVIGAENKDMKSYKRSLIKAKEKTLPDLFKQVENNNAQLAEWLGADILTVKAQLGNMEDVVEVIEDRIFHVEIYAGLTEQIITVQGGKPASITEKLKLMQGRLYMDEECLIDYDAGGMSFGDIKDFNKWLLRPHNLNAILPHPRCMVAFRVRRHSREHEGLVTIHDFINAHAIDEEDKRTFLYIRNGEQVYLIVTEVDLRESLFPDVSEFNFNEPMMARDEHSDGWKIISKREYEILVEKRDEEERIRKKKYEEWEAENAKKSKKERRDSFFNPFTHTHDFHSLDQFSIFDKTNVYYDDIKQSIADDMKYYNRIVLILQGLFDRSPILNPHPPAQLYNPASFGQLVELVYDRDRALYAGEKPDFEAFRIQLNSHFKVGSVVIGMREVWKKREKEKEEALKRKYGERYHGRWSYYRDPGPGFIMKVTSVVGTKVSCEYIKPRQKGEFANSYMVRYGRALEGKAAGDPMTVKLTADMLDVFNASAYTPGDYKMFFNDPRTRRDYLKWAPFLLGAEDYHAGKRKVGQDKKGDE